MDNVFEKTKFGYWRLREHRCILCGSGMCACGTSLEGEAPFYAHCQSCDNKTEAIYCSSQEATVAWNIANPEQSELMFSSRLGEG